MTFSSSKSPIPRQQLWLLLGLIVASTLLFVIGIFLERAGERHAAVEIRSTPISVTAAKSEGNESAGERSEDATAVATVHSENGESGGETSQEATLAPTPHSESGETGNEASEGATAAPTAHSESNESGGEHIESSSEQAGESSQAEAIMGINIENPAFVVAAVVVWLALIGLLMWLGRPILLLIVLVALGNALFDMAEVVFQLGRSNGELTLVAVVVTIAHIAVAVVAGMILMQRTTPSSAGANS